MVVDLRHETAALTPLTAGNYERHHETNPENQTDPGAVRKSFEQSRGQKCKPRTFKVGDLLCLPKFSFFFCRFHSRLGTGAGWLFSGGKAAVFDLDFRRRF